MDAVSIMYTISTVIAVAILVWLNTGKGKKWLSNLR